METNIETKLKQNLSYFWYDFICELYSRRIIEIRFNNDTLLFSEIAKRVNELNYINIANYTPKYSLENIDIDKLKEYLEK